MGNPARVRKTYAVAREATAADIQVEIDVRVLMTPVPVVFLLLPSGFGPVVILFAVFLQVLTVSLRFPLVPFMVVFRFLIIVAFVLVPLVMFVVGHHG